MEQLPFSTVEFTDSCLNLARSTPSTITRMLDILQTFKQKGTFIDLGCGKGTVAIEASKRGFQSTGIDSNPDLITLGNNLKSTCYFTVQDIFTQDLDEFDIMYCYLFETTLKKLKPRLIERLARKTGILISLLYPIQELTPVFVDLDYQIFVYSSLVIASTLE
jgi:SAM-dependent methyltransferase